MNLVFGFVLSLCCFDYLITCLWRLGLLVLMVDLLLLYLFVIGEFVG